VVTSPRYIKARKAVAKLLGREYESRDEATQKAAAAEAKRKAAAATAPVNPTAQAGFGNADIKAQIYGKKSDPWTGRAITVLERNKVDFDFIDVEEPEHEHMLVPLSNETKQHTVPFVFLRGQFIGGFNALAEIERLGQLEYALMTQAERDKAPAHIRVEIVPRPNTDEVAPAEQTPGE
jgi:glutaredoxin